jgi:hypothetical protein
MIIRNTTPRNEQGLDPRGDKSQRSQRMARKCDEKDRGQIHGALYFSLSPNILPVVMLTRCIRAQAGQVTAS